MFYEVKCIQIYAPNVLFELGSFMLIYNRSLSLSLMIVENSIEFVIVHNNLLDDFLLCTPVLSCGLWQIVFVYFPFGVYS